MMRCHLQIRAHVRMGALVAALIVGIFQFRCIAFAADRMVASKSNPTHEFLSTGPWRIRPIEGKSFWFTLGGGYDSPAHVAIFEKHDIADRGFPYCAVGEWEYSFHHIKPGEKDGAGYVHHGGYPTPPQSRAEAAAVVRAYYEKLRADALAKATPEQRNTFVSFNGHHCYQHYACEWGCDIVGSEVGENINSVQMHIAFTRGAARQYGKPWLIDFSSWYGPSMYDEDPGKHWGDYSGPDHGHSINLHERTYFAAYMAGANVVVAEGGWLNFFRSQTPGADGTLPLSRLGEAGARFYRFTKHHPDRGIPYTPIALLIDFHHGIYPGFGEQLAWNAFPYTDGDQRILDCWKTFFPDSVDVMQKKNEQGYLVASPFGDIVDVLLTNAPDDVLASYPAAILAGELTGEEDLAPRLRRYVRQGGTLVLHKSDAKRPAIAKALHPPEPSRETGYTTKRLRRGSIIVYADGISPQLNPLTGIVERLRNELVPFKVTGKVQTLFNRTHDGWLLAIINNEGVTKAYREPPVIDPAGRQEVTIEYTGTTRIRCAALAGNDLLDLENPERVSLVLEPGKVEWIRFSTTD